MKITEMLKSWLIENCGCKATDGDDDLRKAAGTALAEEKLATEKLVELTKDPDSDGADEFDKKLTSLTDQIEKLTVAMTPNAETKDEKKKEEIKDEKETEDGIKDEKKTETKDAPQPSRMAKMIASLGGTPDVTDGKGIDVRVKEAVESYDANNKTALRYPTTTKNGTPHAMAGRRVTDQGRGLDESSDRDKALSGVWAKWICALADPRFGSDPRRVWKAFSEHDKGLLAHLAENEMWDDTTAEFLNADGSPMRRERKGYPGGIKALIDDGGASGALEAAPIVFDDDVISIPLLNGELFPQVRTVSIPRGRRIEGVSVLNVTGGWGGVDGTDIALFNTAGYIAAFDTTIYRWEGAIEIGLDFMSDTPIDFGSIITAQYGQRLLTDLDNAIAVGNGTNRPEGVITNGGTAVGWGGANSIGNMELLRFSVPKAEMQRAAGSAVFCATETTYQRIKALPLAAADSRRLFAGASTNVGTYDDYSAMGRPFKINEGLTNAQVFFAVLNQYRMYRRKGLTVRSSTEGRTLIRSNMLLISVTTRWGGQLERAAVAGVVTTAPA